MGLLERMELQKKQEAADIPEKERLLLINMKT